MDGRRSIETIVSGYSDLRLEGTSGLRRRRIEAVLARLLDCLEEEGPALVAPEDRALVELDRELGEERPFLRLMGADALILVLARFLQERWLPDEKQDRLAQLRVVEGLDDWVTKLHLVRRDLWRAQLELRVAVQNEKDALLRPARRRPRWSADSFGG